MDLDEIRSALAKSGWYHANVGSLDRNGLVDIATAFGQPFESEESHGHIVSTYERIAADPDERIGLEFHNEAVYLEDEPNVVLFYCAGNEEFSGGGTGLIASETILKQFTAAERKDADEVEGVICLSRRYRKPYRLIRQHPATGSPSIYYAARFPRVLHPLPIPRILLVDSERSLEILDRVDECCLAMHEFVSWSPGTLLVIDNYRALHARYAVTGGRLVLWRVLCR